MFRNVLVFCILVFFSAEAFGQWTSGRGADMRKTEALLDSLHVATKTMTESSQRVETLTTEITLLTRVLAILAILQFLVLVKEGLIKLLEKIWALMLKSFNRLSKYLSEKKP